jgi:GH18 family chitinase
MQAKARYLESLGLGGVMLWELSGDRGGVLIDALNAELVG